MKRCIVLDLLITVATIQAQGEGVNLKINKNNKNIQKTFLIFGPSCKFWKFLKLNTLRSQLEGGRSTLIFYLSESIHI